MSSSFYQKQMICRPSYLNNLIVTHCMVQCKFATSRQKEKNSNSLLLYCRHFCKLAKIFETRILT